MSDINCCEEDEAMPKSGSEYRLDQYGAHAYWWKGFMSFGINAYMPFYRHKKDKTFSMYLKPFDLCLSKGVWGWEFSLSILNITVNLDYFDTTNCKAINACTVEEEVVNHTAHHDEG